MNMWIKKQIKTLHYHATLIKMTTRIYQPQKSKVNRSKGGLKCTSQPYSNVAAQECVLRREKKEEEIHDFPTFSIGARNQIWLHFQGGSRLWTRLDNQTIRTRRSQVGSKIQCIKTKRLLKSFFSAFFFLSLFVLFFSPLLNSAQIPTPCSHYNLSMHSYYF